MAVSVLWWTVLVRYCSFMTCLEPGPWAACGGVSPSQSFVWLPDSYPTAASLWAETGWMTSQRNLPVRSPSALQSHAMGNPWVLKDGSAFASPSVCASVCVCVCKPNDSYHYGNMGTSPFQCLYEHVCVCLCALCLPDVEPRWMCNKKIIFL